MALLAALLAGACTAGPPGTGSTAPDDAGANALESTVPAATETTSPATAPATDPPPTTAAPSSTTGVQPAPDIVEPVVLDSHPHDPAAFTQGLVLHEGRMYESTGLYGESSLREVDVESGRVERQIDLDPELFGEGLAVVGDSLLQLTWREEVALVHDLHTFETAEPLTYEGEGWGLCNDGEALWMSDGTAGLTRRDPATFEILEALEVRRAGEPVELLNELECVNGLVYANVWRTDEIVVIDPADGDVVRTVDASGLLSAETAGSLGPDAVLNGIAHDPVDDAFLLTGKLWPELFRVRLP